MQDKLDLLSKWLLYIMGGAALLNFFAVMYVTVSGSSAAREKGIFMWTFPMFALSLILRKIFSYFKERQMADTFDEKQLRRRFRRNLGALVLLSGIALSILASQNVMSAGGGQGDLLIFILPLILVPTAVVALVIFLFAG